MTSNKISQIVEMIESLSVVELKELVDVVKEKFGVTTIGMAPLQQVGTQQTAEPVEEKTDFEVVLTSFGNSKLNVIKEVRTITGLGLKEAKDLVEGVPKTLKAGVTKEEANKIKETIEKAGGTVELK